MDAVDRRLLDQVQAGVPLTPRPFAAVGAALEILEDEVVRRLGALREEGLLRQIGAIFETRACGYESALVAARVPPREIESAAAMISRHPGVTHCYERDHTWNLWFTLAVPPESGLGLSGTVERVGAEAGAGSIRVLPALRVFKISARFKLEEGIDLAPPRTGARSVDEPPVPLGDDEIAAVRVLQRPLPLIEEPFLAAAGEAGMSQDELLSTARELLALGVMRRFAALLHHRRAGFGANVMGVWSVSQDRVADAGARVASLSAVSHCYERPTYSDWPYSLFSMIHGKSREECVAVIDEIRRMIAPDEDAALWTVREFKKTRLQLFTAEYAAWERARPGASVACALSR